MIFLARIVAIIIAAPLVLAALLLDVPFRLTRIIGESWRAADAANAAPFVRMPTHEGSTARH